MSATTVTTDVQTLAARARTAHRDRDIYSRDEAIVQLRRTGLTYARIAELVGTSVSLVRDALVRNDAAGTRTAKRYSHRRRPLTPKVKALAARARKAHLDRDVPRRDAAIVQLRGLGLQYAQIAVLVGTSKSVVGFALGRRNATKTSREWWRPSLTPEMKSLVRIAKANSRSHRRGKPGHTRQVIEARAARRRAAVARLSELGLSGPHIAELIGTGYGAVWTMLNQEAAAQKGKAK